MSNLFYDGFNSKLIETASYNTVLEIPILEAPKETIIPSVAVPFSKRKSITKPREEILVFYEQDPLFRKFVSIPQKFMKELENVYIFSTPDCSLYRDMPLWEQVAGLKHNRHVSDGKPIYGIYKGVRVGVIRTNGKIATVFPDANQTQILKKRRK